MKKLKAFKHVFAKSATSIDYYKELQKVDLKFSLKYYFMLALFLALVVATVDTIKASPGLKESLTNVRNSALELYPNDLIIEVEDGTISINMPEPLIIPFPVTGTGEKIGDAQPTNYKNIIVFDSQGTINDLEKHSTLVLVNEKNILVDEGTGVQAYPISSLPNGVLQKDDLIQFMNGFGVIADFAPLALFLATFTAMAFYYVVVRTVYLLFVAAVLMAVGYAKGTKNKYSKFYQIGLHAMTVPLLIELVMILSGFSFGIPFWFFVLNVILGVIVVFSFSSKKKKQPAKA